MQSAYFCEIVIIIIVQRIVTKFVKRKKLEQTIDSQSLGHYFLHQKTDNQKQAVSSFPLTFVPFSGERQTYTVGIIF